jgi:MOSC domain-containing protein YiiM
MTTGPSALGTIVSVNAGAPRSTAWGGRNVVSGIWKEPVSGPVSVRGVNLAGDDQADRRVHGGPDKAVYAYALEDYEWWSAELLQEIAPATFGENLTTAGVDLHRVVIGERWRIGTVLLEAREPRLPCFKLGMRMGDASFVQRFERARRNGVYLSIIEAGELRAGDTIELVERPEHALLVADLVRAYHDGDTELVERVATDGTVSETWRGWALRALDRRRGP